MHNDENNKLISIQTKQSRKKQSKGASGFYLSQAKQTKVKQSKMPEHDSYWHKNFTSYE